MWGYPYLTYLTIACMIGIVVAMAFIPQQRMSLALGVVSLLLLLLAYAARGSWRSRRDIAPETAEAHNYNEF
jgi:GABA permease